MLRRRAAGILLVCAVLLTGCGQTEQPPVTDELEVTQDNERARYSTEELSLPDEAGSFVADLQGNPAIYNYEMSLEDEMYQASVSRWTLDENSDWNCDDLCQESLSEFLDQKYERVGWTRCFLDNFKRGDNGSLYGIFTYYVKEKQEIDGELTELICEKYSILEFDEENDRVFEIPLEIAPKARLDDGRSTWEDEMAWISDYHVFEEGNILCICGESGGGYGYLIDGETGKTIQDMGNIVTGMHRFAFGENEIIFYSNSINKFQVLSLSDMKEENTFGSLMDENVRGLDWYFYMNPDTWELYLCSIAGVYRATDYQSSDEVQQITESDVMESLEMEDATLHDFFMRENGDFYLYFSDTTIEYEEENTVRRLVHFIKEE